MTVQKSISFDAFLPDDMAAKAEEIGVKKAQLGWKRLFVLGILAGAFIAMGAIFATTVVAGTGGSMAYGVVRLLGGFEIDVEPEYEPYLDEFPLPEDG